MGVGAGVGQGLGLGVGVRVGKGVLLGALSRRARVRSLRHMKLSSATNACVSQHGPVATATVEVA
jgi:hypothetical protein